MSRFGNYKLALEDHERKNRNPLWKIAYHGMGILASLILGMGIGGIIFAISTL